jgi:hypothetical protein
MSPINKLALFFVVSTDKERKDRSKSHISQRLEPVTKSKPKEKEKEKEKEKRSRKESSAVKTESTSTASGNCSTNYTHKNMDFFHRIISALRVLVDM